MHLCCMTRHQCHAACPCSCIRPCGMTKKQGHSAWTWCIYCRRWIPIHTWCMDTLHGHAACTCCVFMHVHAYPVNVHTECPCCLSTLHEHAGCPCCVSMLHVHVSRTCYMPMLHEHSARTSAWTRCANMLHEHAKWTCCIKCYMNKQSLLDVSYFTHGSSAHTFEPPCQCSLARGFLNLFFNWKYPPGPLIHTLIFYKPGFKFKELWEFEVRN